MVELGSCRNVLTFLVKVSRELVTPDIKDLLILLPDNNIIRVDRGAEGSSSFSTLLGILRKRIERLGITRRKQFILSASSYNTSGLAWGLTAGTIRVRRQACICVYIVIGMVEKVANSRAPCQNNPFYYLDFWSLPSVILVLRYDDTTKPSKISLICRRRDWVISE